VTVVLCPGQGTQRVGMGRDLAERFPAAREAFARVDEALGLPLSRLMWEGPEDELTLTHNAQPAILAHTLAVLAVAGDRLGPLGAAAGHSLGEYGAYVAAGALRPEDAVRLVRRRGELMAEAGRARPGAMAVVLGLGVPAVQEACLQANDGRHQVVAANINAPDQVVISGDPPAVERAGVRCREAGAKRVLPLKVSGAFHSPLMAPAAPGLAEALAGAALRDPACAVVANATAQPVRHAADARRLLVEQLTAPVQWVASVEFMAHAVPAARWLEVGPGNVLAGLVKKIAPGTAVRTLGTAAELEAFLGA